MVGFLRSITRSAAARAGAVVVLGLAGMVEVGAVAYAAEPQP